MFPSSSSVEIKLFCKACVKVITNDKKLKVNHYFKISMHKIKFQKIKPVSVTTFQNVEGKEMFDQDLNKALFAA